MESTSRQSTSNTPSLPLQQGSNKQMEILEISSTETGNALLDNNLTEHPEAKTLRLVFKDKVKVKQTNMLIDVKLRIFLCLALVLICQLNAILISLCRYKMCIDVKNLNDIIMIFSAVFLAVNGANVYVKFHKILIYLILCAQTICATASSLVLLFMIKIIRWKQCQSVIGG